MQGLKTFVHQKRFQDGQVDKFTPVSRLSSSRKEEEEGDSTIDHRLVEAHRLRWQKRVDWVMYILAAAFLLYSMYQWIVLE